MTFHKRLHQLGMKHTVLDMEEAELVGPIRFTKRLHLGLLAGIDEEIAEAYLHGYKIGTVRIGHRIHGYVG